MSRLVSRILLSMFMFPLAVMFYFLVTAIGEESQKAAGFIAADRQVPIFLASSIVTWAAVAAYWCLLWRTGVIWNSTRIAWTILAAVFAAIVGGGGGMMMMSLFDVHDLSAGICLGGILAIMLWLIATVLIWRETTGERAERIKGSTKSAVTCPACGYNLTGLSQSRCPECGSAFTLDELLALQVTTDKEID
jgi:hypothetical protein